MYTIIPLKRTDSDKPQVGTRIQNGEKYMVIDLGGLHKIHFNWGIDCLHIFYRHYAHGVLFNKAF